jgi:uncharacterized protein (DUF427 family)
VLQVQARRWRTLRAAASLWLASFWRTFLRERRKTDLAWEFYFPLFATSLPHDLRERRLVMRRRVNGMWQYRSPTPEEEEEYVASDAW